MADAFAGYDVARLAFNGTNASTTMTDSLGHTFTASGAAQLDTSRFAEGVSSLALATGGTDYIQSANSADWNMGSGDFCVDCMVNANNIGGFTNDASMISVNDGTTTAFTLALQGGGSNYAMKPRGTVWIGGVAKDILATNFEAYSYIYDRRWYHLSLTRKSGVLYLWLDGMLLGSVAAAGALDWNTSMVLSVGKQAPAAPGGTPGQGSANIDMVRVTKGHYRYDAPFVPPVDSNFNTYSANVTVTSEGTNTRHVYVNNETNVDAIIAGCDLAITQLGWTIYGSVYYGQKTRVYRALNKDGVSYKYAVLIWDTPRQQLNLTTCESWDQATRTMLNEVDTCNRSIGRMGYGFHNCDIFFFGNARYLGMMTYLHGSASQWALIVENEREAPEDTGAAGYPCWGLINPVDTFVMNAGVAASWGVAMPRTRDGHVGSTAKKSDWGTQLSFGTWGSVVGLAAAKPVSTVYSTSATMANITHAWDTAKKLVSSIRMIKWFSTGQYQITTYGRLFGVKFCPPVGTTMDKVRLPIDSDGFYASGGTLSDHWILPISTLNMAAGATNVIGNGSGGNACVTTTTSTGAAVLPQCIAFSGKFAYLGAAGGIYKYNVETGVVATVISGTAQDIYDIAFDGRYVWGAGASNLVRVDTANADTVTLSGALPLQALALDGMGHVFATSRTSSLTPAIYKIDAQTLTTMVTANVATRVTTGFARSIAHNGIDTAAIVCGNPTTAADLCISYLPVGNAGATTYTLSTGFLCTSTGVVWAGTEWIALHSNDAAGTATVYGNRMTGNTGTIAGTAFTALTTATITAVAPFIIRHARAGGFQAIDVPSSAAQIGIYTVAVPPDNSLTLNAVTSAGTWATTTGVKAMCFTGNSMFFAPQAGTTTYYLKDMWRSTSALLNNAHILIPR